ncbi:FERM domain-containing protein 6 [Lampetra fluviatilis]
MSGRLGFQNNRRMQERRRVRVLLPTGDDLSIIIPVKTTCRELFSQVCDLLKLKDPNFFGLSVLTNNEHIFMDLEQKLTKYCPKEWKKEASRGIDHFGPPFNIHFRVQYYVENGKLISDRVARFYYYNHLKSQVLSSQCALREEAYFLLAAHALQADLGDFRPSRHQGRYFHPEAYFPAWVIKKRGGDYIVRHVPAMHQDQAGMSANESQLCYIREAARLEDVPVHFYALFKEKKDDEPTLLLGLTLKGLQIYQGLSAESQQLLYDFPWSNVGKLIFMGKKFEMEPDGLPSARKLVFYTGSPLRSRHLLLLLSTSHRLFMTVQPLLRHLRRLEDSEAQKRYRESYISDALEMELERLGSRARSSGESSGESSGGTISGGGSVVAGGIAAGRAGAGSFSSVGSTNTSGIESDAKTQPGKEPCSRFPRSPGSERMSCVSAGRKGPLQACSSVDSHSSSHTSGVGSAGQEHPEGDSPLHEVEMLVDDPSDLVFLQRADSTDDSISSTYIYVTQEDLETPCVNTHAGLVVKMLSCGLSESPDLLQGSPGITSSHKGQAALKAQSPKTGRCPRPAFGAKTSKLPETSFPVGRPWPAVSASSAAMALLDDESLPEFVV